jgi:hypothetical protein
MLAQRIAEQIDMVLRNWWRSLQAMDNFENSPWVIVYSAFMV